ncbi:MAG: hypothetical protein ACM3ZV_06920 [Bacillota bacterium]
MSDSDDEQIPTFEELAADPEIAPLLEFEPVPRKRLGPDAWTAERQREFIARLATHGSPGLACAEMGKHLTGMDKVKRSPDAASFRAAWKEAIALARRRKAEREQKEYLAPGETLPTIDRRFKRRCAEDVPAPAPPPGGQESEILNEYGEWEDGQSYARRVEEAKDSVSEKFTRCRRLYLMSIADQPVKRAAFEILTGWPVDWERARALAPQPLEPWRKPSPRHPDMLLAAEHGCLAGFVHGPDERAALLRKINAWRAKRGEAPLRMDEDEEGEE